MEQSSEADLNREGKCIGFASEKDWLCVRVSLSFTLAQETQERLFYVSSPRFACLFLSDLSYCLTAVCGRGQESD